MQIQKTGKLFSRESSSLIIMKDMKRGSEGFNVMSDRVKHGDLCVI